MRLSLYIALLASLLAASPAAARDIRVPTRTYPTIQRAIDAADDGDVVVVGANPGPPYSYTGTYTGVGNTNLRFRGKAITVTSDIDPNNPDWGVINATVIDCQGSKYNHSRGFVFDNGELPASRLIGITIKNGWESGPVGEDGIIPGEPISCDEDTCPPQAAGGAAAVGDGFGGGILCYGASPTIMLCRIEGCTITGAQGGRGADGEDGTWSFEDPKCEDPDPAACEIEVEDGQWGGIGGEAKGDGYGGGIACLSASPVIDGCVIIGNTARGAVGGDGGDGGDGDDGEDGKMGKGGDGGKSAGDGFGGGIYSDSLSRPVVIDCTISDNLATEGLAGVGGSPGSGDDLTEDELGESGTASGIDGEVANSGRISGGGAYYDINGAANFSGTAFTNNTAKVSMISAFTGMELAQYFAGGGIYAAFGNNLRLNGCRFELNTGSAVYCETGCILDFDDTVFTNNSETDYGGAVYVSGGGAADLAGCTFTGNTADFDGGGMECQSSATLTNCSFNDNDCNGFGGGLDIFSGANRNVNLSDCIFRQNRGLWGGGFFCENFTGSVNDCYYIDNTAQAGGAMYLTYGQVTIDGGVISGNTTTDGTGGGFKCVGTDIEVTDCRITDNTAGGQFGSGGGISLEATAVQTLKNCLLTGNAAAVNGGAVYCGNAEPEIANCTFQDNSASGSGGGVYLSFNSTGTIITDCIITRSERVAVYEDDGGGDAVLRNCLFHDNYQGDFHDSQSAMTVTGAAAINALIAGASGNIDGDPLFVSGPLGGFYLDQSFSPAIDAGSDTAVNAGLDGYTTDPADSPDAGQVDIGYHNKLASAAVKYQLTVTVVGDHGTVTPAGGTYFAGTVVTLTADPDTAWRVESWSGTDNDVSTETTNSIVMNTDRDVTVIFGQPRTLVVSVGGSFEGHYPNIHAANHAARDGDTIVVYPGVYQGSPIHLNKSVTVRSLNPDDPAVVAATIIDGSEYAGPRVYLEPGKNNARTVLNGLTFQNATWFVVDAMDGDRGLGHPDGFDGGGAAGGIIYIRDLAGPVIKNCVIRDNSITGANAGSGEDATDEENAGRGGWGGWARGGAVYCGIGSTPSFINCQIVDNIARGGNGGNGGDGTDAGSPNYGGNWSRAEWYNVHSDSLIIEFVEEDLWSVWERFILGIDEEGNEIKIDLPPYIGDYRWYSAYGGGVYCDANSVVAFTDCTISGNRTYGGMSGIGGSPTMGIRTEPVVSYEIPSFGGGVYCAGGSTVDFTGCTISDNIASEPENDPNDDDNGFRYHVDPYLGHGGGICAEDTAKVTFTDCVLRQNKASIGGGMQFANADPDIRGCDFIANSAYHGGAVFANDDSGVIAGCNMLYNEAASDIFDFNDPNLALEETLGKGGAVHLWRTAVKLIDCDISFNEAESSGGGVYVGGENFPGISNCLIVKNTAGRDGAGVSANLYSQLTISNSTIADNAATSEGFTNSYGGGLYSSYEAVTSVIDSVIWGNSADRGRQLAVGSGFEYDKSPAEVHVSYSDIQYGATGAYIENGSVLIWDDASNLDGTVLSDPNFVCGDPNFLRPNICYYLSNPDVFPPDPNQLVLSPAVDAGSDTADALGLYRHTTRTDLVLDSGLADLGFHYLLGTDLIGDFDFDGDVDMADMAILLANWLADDCRFPDWCRGTDLNEDGKVNLRDEAIFSRNYSLEETVAPKPDPMTWQVPPVSFGSGSVAMIASDATDNSTGTQVEYYFQCVYGNCHDRPWDPCSTYIDTGLAGGEKYGYRVKARDTSANLNETGWSLIGYAVTGVDSTDIAPPAPDPMTWSIVPYASSSRSISMTATTALDASGVEYYFQSLTFGGHDSGWQDSPAYVDPNLVPDTTYTYRVKARDKSVWQNETDWSAAAPATTLSEDEPDPNEPPGPTDDVTPPTPDPAQWSVSPQQTFDGGSYVHNMAAVDATDADNPPVEYYFGCVSGNCLDSGWQAESTYTYQAGLSTICNYRVRARDAVGNVTAWSETRSTSTF